MPATKLTIPKADREYYNTLYGDDWDIGSFCLVGIPKVDSDTDKRQIPRDIDISAQPGVPLPNDYIKLIVEIENSLTVLKVIFPDERLLNRFQQYFEQLKNLARASLGQDQILLGNLAIQMFQVMLSCGKGVG